MGTDVTHCASHRLSTEGFGDVAIVSYGAGVGNRIHVQSLWSLCWRQWEKLGPTADKLGLKTCTMTQHKAYLAVFAARHFHRATTDCSLPGIVRRTPWRTSIQTRTGALFRTGHAIQWLFYVLSVCVGPWRTGWRR